MGHLREGSLVRLKCLRCVLVVWTFVMVASDRQPVGDLPRAGSYHRATRFRLSVAVRESVWCRRVRLRYGIDRDLAGLHRICSCRAGAACAARRTLDRRRRDGAPAWQRGAWSPTSRCAAQPADRVRGAFTLIMSANYHASPAYIAGRSPKARSRWCYTMPRHIFCALVAHGTRPCLVLEARRRNADRDRTRALAWCIGRNHAHDRTCISLLETTPPTRGLLAACIR